MRKLQPSEVVAICDHLCFLDRSELEDKVRREAGFVTFYLLIQPFRRYTEQLSEVSINHYSLATNQQDSWFDGIQQDKR
ncbi:MAG TPA: hypothetical protein PLN21_14765 [Gemmatales bacterium]|nr:hypothetical protein [Gemmatales bacterium]